MKKQKLREQIIKLLEMGFDAELISFELEIPTEDIEECRKQLEPMNNDAEQEKESNDEATKIDYDEIINKYKEQIQREQEQLQLRTFARNSLLDGNVQEAIKKLRNFVNQSEENVVESLMLQKLETLSKGHVVKINDLQDIEASKNRINIQRTLNLLAFAYFKSGKINEAREKLQKIIDEYGDYNAYRQLIHIEKTQGNNEDYELWLYECLDKFPRDIWTRKQLLSIAKQKGDKKEQIKLLKEILDINPINEEAKIELEDMIR